MGIYNLYTHVNIITNGKKNSWKFNFYGTMAIYSNFLARVLYSRYGKNLKTLFAMAKSASNMATFSKLYLKNVREIAMAKKIM